MERKKSSPFEVVHRDNIAFLEPRGPKTDEPVAETTQSATAATDSPPTSANTANYFSPLDVERNFSMELLNEALSDIYRVTQELQLALVEQYFGAEDARGEDIRQVLALKQLQINCGRRDHTRSELMLGAYRNIRGRLALACREDHGNHRSIDVRLDLNTDRQLAELLAPLMHLSAAYTPDDSEYSKHWREVLMAHVVDLRLIIWSVLGGHSLELPYYQRHPLATGRFAMPTVRPQKDVVLELQRDYGYTVLKHKGSTAVCCSSIAKQIVLVGADGVRRDVAVLSLMNDLTDLTHAEESATVGFAIRRLLRMSGCPVIDID